MTKLRGKKHTIGGMCCGFIFWWQIFAILQKTRKTKKIEKNMLSQVPFFFGTKNCQEMKEKKSQKKLPTNHHNCLQCEERVLKICSTFIFCIP
jgi:hypothetical protein